MPNVMATQPNIGGAICESSVLPFVVPCHKVYLTPTDRVPCSNAANIGEHKTWTQSEVCTWKNSVRGQKVLKKCIYSVPDQETAEDRAKIGWLPMNDVTPVTKPRHQTHQPISAVSGSKFAILWGHLEEKLLFNKFLSDC